jgi:cytochrome c-type biogenesis protein CcmH
MMRPAVALLLMVLALPVFAVQPDEILADPVMEARARDISADLRCLVCQNQSIDDSDAPLARDLRILVRERLLAGDTNQEAVAYIVDRYGDYVLLKPPFNAETLLLWAAPLGALAIGAVIVVVFMRRRSGEPVVVAQALTEDEKARLKDLMRSEGS